MIIFRSPFAAASKQPQPFVVVSASFFGKSTGIPSILMSGPGLPGDEHRHHDRLPAPRRHLRREPVQPRIRLGRRVQKVVLNPLIPDLLRDLRDVHKRLHCLDLAIEEGTLPLGVRPMLEESPRDGGRVERVPPFPPLFHASPDLVDGRILLDPVPGPIAERLLPGPTLRGCAIGTK